MEVTEGGEFLEELLRSDLVEKISYVKSLCIDIYTYTYIYRYICICAYDTDMYIHIHIHIYIYVCIRLHILIWKNYRCMHT